MFQKNIVDVRVYRAMGFKLLLISIILGRGAHHDPFPPRISYS